MAGSEFSLSKTLAFILLLGRFYDEKLMQPTCVCYL